MSTKGLSKYINSMVPDKLQEKTVGELLASGDTDIIIKGRKLTAKKKVGERQMVLSIENIKGLSEMSITSASCDLSKGEKIQLVKKLRKEGRKQQEIADIIGKSQSYVSQLLKSK